VSAAGQVHTNSAVKVLNGGDHGHVIHDADDHDGADRAI